MEDAAAPLQERLREILRSVGEAGLTKAAIAKAFKPKGRQTKEAKAAAEDSLRQTLQTLETAGELVNFGTAKTPRFVLAKFDRRLELARDFIERKSTPGKATVFNRAALGKGGPKNVAKSFIDEAIAGLLREHRLILIQPGKSVFYLHADSVAPLIAPGLGAAAQVGTSSPGKPPESSPKPPLPRGDVFSPEAVRAAYTQLVREGGFADVLIAELQQCSGAALPDLQAWLREQSRAGRAAPTRGDWSLAGAAARNAAIEVRGEPHLQVRLL